jgi:hypothetical protein
MTTTVNSHDNYKNTENNTNITMDDAINDFVKGNGTGMPSDEVCLKLLNSEMVMKSIKDALNQGVKKIGIMPYDGRLIFVHNPVYIGYCSMSYRLNFRTDDDKKQEIEVCFDRN